MSLAPELAAQLVKTLNQNKKSSSNTTHNGEIIIIDGKEYVKLDGSDYYTPIQKTVSVKEEDRVTVEIKDHIATVTGNLTDNSASTTTVNKVSGQVTEFENLVAHKITTDELTAINATIDTLIAKVAEIGNLEAINAEIENLKATYANIEKLTATDIEALNATIDNLKVKIGEFDHISADDMEVINAQIDQLKVYNGDFVYLSAERLQAIKAEIENLDVKYATIDFANIDKVAMEYFYAKSGLIEDVTIGDATITGRLVGVTISGDVIEGNTVVANKLVIQGEDGLFYKLNTDGLGNVSTEQTEYNSINGSIIMAKSISADKIAATDLVAFKATIGGFSITDDSIYSTIKDSEDNQIRGIYMDKNGQFNIGDDKNFVKYYMTEDGNYKLAISAESILYALNGNLHSLTELGNIGEYVKIGTYDDEPCIELGESDSNFKLIITNTKVMFKQGTNTPAELNNRSLDITNANIKGELQQGGFVWKQRSNGNLGLIWRGVTS